MLCYEVDPTTHAVTMRPLAAISGDIPEVNGAKHGQAYEYAYCVAPEYDGNEPDRAGFVWFHALAKIDVNSGKHTLWHAGADHFVSGPTFVPRNGASDEDDGYLLAYDYDAPRRTADIVVLDARAIDRGPVARIKLGRHLPAANHTAFFGDVDVT